MRYSSHAVVATRTSQLVNKVPTHAGTMVLVEVITTHVMVHLMLIKLVNVSIVAKWAIGHVTVTKGNRIRLGTRVCTLCRHRVCMAMMRLRAQMRTHHLHQKTEDGADY